MIALTTLGNRAAGQEGFGTFFGVAIMTLGVTIARPVWWAIPLYYATLFLWRRPSPLPWVHLAQGTGTWLMAVLRGLYIIPFALVVSIISHSILPFLVGILASVLVPMAYLVGFRYKKQPGPLAELLAGAVVGMI